MRFLPALTAAVLLTACSTPSDSGDQSRQPETPETLAGQIERKVAALINEGQSFFLSGDSEEATEQ